MTSHSNVNDKKEPHTGKVSNDTNQQGKKHPTQLNQGQRIPESRSDREAHIGGSNQTQSRRGSTGNQNR